MAIRPATDCQIPATIIITEANMVPPTAQPLAALARLDAPYRDASSAICRSSPACRSTRVAVGGTGPAAPSARASYRAGRWTSPVWDELAPAPWAVTVVARSEGAPLTGDPSPETGETMCEVVSGGAGEGSPGAAHCCVPRLVPAARADCLDIR